MPIVTPAQRHKLNRDPVADPHIVLLEFQEDGQAAIERAAINTEDIEWNGHTYHRAAIEITLPSSGDGETRAQLVASNVDRIISRALNAATQRVNVRIILIDVTAPDMPLVDTQNLLVIPSASGGAVEVTADLGPRASLQEPVPFRRTTKQDFPGVWLA